MQLHPESENYLEKSREWPLPRKRAAGREAFYRRAGKRILDVSCAVGGLVLLAPLFLVVTVLLKLTSSRPVLFRQPRVGRKGRIFLLVKFRSMVDASGSDGPSITVLGDSRVTRLGAWLRRFKIDELPQLWNVLRGEMSLVGPRPEVEPYVAEYTHKQRRVLEVRPGITDPASIAYRHEEKLLAVHPDPEGFYRTTVLPHKLSLNLEYIENISFRRDVSLILKTLRSIIS